MQRNLSREAHLWHTVTLPEYMDRAHDHLQKAFDYLVLDVRSGSEPLAGEYPPVPYWGGRMEYLLQTYSNARAALSQGDFDPMGTWDSSLSDIPRGFQEGITHWMDHVNEFWGELNAAYSIASRFSRALSMSNMYSSDDYKDRSADWHYEIPEDMGYPGDDIAVYSEEHIFPQLPAEIPEYAADTSVTCKTGDIVPWTGVWVPTTGMGTAALVFARKHLQIMQASYEVTKNGDDETFTVVDTCFHPVKPTGRMIPHPAMAGSPATATRPNVPAGQPCPEAGWWFTPAKPDSRRHFKQGEIMPSTGGDYGQTFWQWSPDQSAPTL
ncbi:hypothetical protein G3580_17415 [Nitrogeniibacter mangrovi]|uniref:Uncharacterized protein n=1 Tax=Nitrogeniibacter mangrovi TaxID=2016596 RepID=A0A6C1B8G5_9RHOO|nr:hypothetical protein [Nitrogeniibacter mangrovi]QID19239.1 hypothetical protein G3580_17415 [Nitrogeniibacter mangrovi]